MAVQWQNSGDRSAVDIQAGGPGNAWSVLDVNAQLDAPSGGARARTTLWGRDEKGGLAPRGFVYTGNPDDWTFNLNYPLTNDNALKRLTCPFTIRARQYCSPNRSAMNSYAAPGMKVYQQTTVTSFGYDNAAGIKPQQWISHTVVNVGKVSINRRFAIAKYQNASTGQNHVQSISANE